MRGDYGLQEKESKAKRNNKRKREANRREKEGSDLGLSSGQAKVMERNRKL